ncbi:MAG TPA: exopolysaccharide biosynthesis polyprenyl glycosylphosphotransferase [Lachnospiraceae bacterium]|nr:exopolysaccharide biosynthesis polyprenyl glycosylphosphotransferase [Lachnospiraceae bacterium]
MDIRRKNKFKLVIEMGVNVLGMALLFSVIWFVFYRYNLQTNFLYKKGTAILIFIYAVLFSIFTSVYGGHKIDYFRVSEIIYSQFLSMVIVNFMVWLQICLIDRRVVEIAPIILLCCVDTAFISFWAFWSNGRYQKRNIVRNISVIYKNIRPEDLVEKMNMYDYKFKVTKILQADGKKAKDIIKNLSTRDGVVLCGIDANLQKEIMKYCFDNTMPIFVIPDTAEIILRSANAISLLDMPVLQCSKGELSVMDEVIKRLFDIVTATIGIIVLSPIMLLVAILIKVYDGGPATYKQERLTINGKKFMVYKFRSMVECAEDDGVARLAKQGDSRITPIGSYIRKLRIDELPQLFNVVKGDMSIVGPRPERPEIAAQYEKTIPEFKYRLKFKAGLTGYAQVLGRYNTTPYDKLMWDLMYIEGYSFLLDLRLIMMTIKILFIPESTQGVDKDSVTADKKTTEKSEYI